MTFRIYYKTLGGHTHMRVFCNGGKAGDLCLRNEEFVSFKKAATFIQFFVEE